MSQVEHAVTDERPSEPAGPERHQTVDPMAMISYLLSGILLYGGIGWLLDRWLGFTSLFLPIGVVLGVIAGGYLGYMRFLKS